MPHYGIKFKLSDGWLRGANGLIFWTTSKAVALAQLEALPNPQDFMIDEFVED